MRAASRLGLVASFLICMSGSRSFGQAQFIPLGFLPNGNFLSSADAVSASAPYTVVGYANTTGVSRQAFRWTQAGGMIGLGGYSEGFDVSADGSVVVGRDYTGGAWRWTSGTGKVSIGAGEADAVSADGSAIVGENNDRGFVWTAATHEVSIPLLPGASASYNPALDVSADGRYVVGQGQGTTITGYEYDTVGNSITVLSPLFGAYGVASDGRTVVGDGNNMTRVVDGVADVNYAPPSGIGRARDVSGDGQTMVGYADETGLVQEALIWDSIRGGRLLQTMLTSEYGLNLTGWHLTRSTGISEDGQAIVGYGTDPSGFTEAWLAIVPEPNSLAVFLAASVLRSRRKRCLKSKPIASVRPL